MLSIKNLLNVCSKKSCFISLQDRSKLKTSLTRKRIVCVFLLNNVSILSFIFYVLLLKLYYRNSNIVTSKNIILINKNKK